MSKAAELAALIGSQTALSNRNLVINGAMQVAQRGTSFSNVGTGTFTLDRFQTAGGSLDNLQVTISQSSTTPGGFSNSLKAVATTAESAVAADEAFLVRTKIEGQNLQHLQYGASAAQPTTVSFYVRSNVTGTYAVYFYSPDGVRIISKTYTINSADTWEYKAITFPGDTSGTINDDNGEGLQIAWYLLAGTNYTDGTGDAWVAYADGEEAANHTADWGEDTNDEWMITGVQLEVGEQATPFEHRSFADELARCQRYLHRIEAPSSGTNYGWVANGLAQNDRFYGVYNFPVQMRAVPTFSSTSGGFNVGMQGFGVSNFSIDETYATTPTAARLRTGSDSNMTNGYGARLGFDQNSAFIQFDAEL